MRQAYDYWQDQPGIYNRHRVGWSGARTQRTPESHRKLAAKAAQRPSGGRTTSSPWSYHICRDLPSPHRQQRTPTGVHHHGRLGNTRHFQPHLKVTMSMGQWLQPAPSRRIRQRIPQDETPHNPARLTYDRANARQSRLAAVRLSLTKTATCFSSHLVADLLTPHIRARK